MACYDFDRMERHMYGMTAIPLTGAIVMLLLKHGQV